MHDSLLHHLVIRHWVFSMHRLIFIPCSVRDVFLLYLLFWQKIVKSMYLSSQNFELTPALPFLIYGLLFIWQLMPKNQSNRIQSWFLTTIIVEQNHCKTIWVKVFKNGPNIIYGRQSLKNLKWYGLLRLIKSLHVF